MRRGQTWAKAMVTVTTGLCLTPHARNTEYPYHKLANQISKTPPRRRVEKGRFLDTAFKPTCTAPAHRSTTGTASLTGFLLPVNRRR